jgi:fructose-specific component phosphotransferase system IIB-like protein
MELESDTYMLLHRMLGAAKTKDELEIVRKRFQAVIDAKRGSAAHDDRFDVAWSMSCLADIYRRLEMPTLAQESYLAAIRLFDENDMPGNSAGMSVALAALYIELERTEDAGCQLKENIRYQSKQWGGGSRQVADAKEELAHFQKTGKMIQAFEHRWCKPCGVDEYGVGFDEKASTPEQETDGKERM